MIDATLKALLLEQCLPILITKASALEVSINRMSVPAVSLTGDEQLHRFHQEFVHRRLLAEMPELFAILQEISHQPSWHNKLERRRDLVLIGRLDVPAYIRERKLRFDRPRTFPIVDHQRHFDTPENRLAAGTLRQIRALLANEVFPAKSAESIVARGYFRQLSRLSSAHAFASNTYSSISRKDLALTRFRVNRRLTGNDRPYRRLLNWIEHWLSLTGLAEEVDGDRAVDLALPESEAYWEKVFEVWCLEQTRTSMNRLGWTTDSDFRIHASQSNKPIATFRLGSRTVEAYFQMQKPLGKGRWLSTVTLTPLAGIPDIVLTTAGSAPLLIDAKWRFRTLKQGTSEEQYKMLGYAENFAHNHPGDAFYGLLVFPSDVMHTQSFFRAETGRLTTMRTDLLSKSFPQLFDDEICHWFGPMPTPGSA
ncbi:hypothetical protein E3T24_05690 [Cryobacterium sp. TmT2-59]|uniref:hypothetical protein n=1 Tax=Cryobacterium sp. TmT2-59 TaxID=1259264 RepID=UPI0010690914|nr:hypothetical protein [Cryobacterium sp. TmT2-59]TFC87154.1 hypothetical protein E3T24_05690 [Cryobacterium sp. TmT2-59]